MLFPATSRTVFARNTLTEVICQFRFPPILQITAEEPVAFQNQVRESYPEYETEAGIPNVPEELKGLLAGMSIKLPGDGLVHRFITEDRARSIALAESYAAVSEHAYKRWEAFRREVQLAKVTTENVYRPAFYSRIGLRYQNTIDRKALGLENVPWSELLQPVFAGILTVANLSERVRQKAVQFLIELDEPEACFVTIRHGLQPRDPGSDVYIIDADFFTTSKMRGDDALDVLDQFHQQAGHFFRWAISEQLRNALGPEPMD